MVPPTVDIGILTIRDDEFRAVLSVFPNGHTIHKGRHREYTLRTTDAGDSASYRIAILRQIEQGNGEAQEAARDLIDDLQPSLLLVVGIAGGLPSDDICFGDVVLSTRIHDFSVEARRFEDQTSYNVGGGPISKFIAGSLANLSARERELGDWWEGLPRKPAVTLTANKLYGPKSWQREVKEKIQLHYGKGVEVRAPIFSAGAIASSDRLVKDPTVLFPWITTARGILAIEMESAGVHRATRDKTPMLSIRGLSDIVGFKRQDSWTKYACASAACFARAYLRTQPVPIRAPSAHQSGSRPARPTRSSGAVIEDSIGETEESFANLIPLRYFPETLYVAPVTTKTKKHSWAVLNGGGSHAANDYIPGAWTQFEGNLYSLVDPGNSRLKSIIDVGGLDNFSSEEWAFSKDDNRRHLFVQLLNSSLREDLWSHGVRYHRDQDAYAFMGRPEHGPRTLKYPNLKVRSTATVVAHYEHKAKNGKTYPYFRHAAFQGRFRLFGNQWYLETTPTYRFTRNGRDLDRYHEDRLSGIKRLERNRSVLSQLLIWQSVLRAPWTVAGRPRLLEFAPLVSFQFTSSIADRLMTALDEFPTRVQAEKESEE